MTIEQNSELLAFDQKNERSDRISWVLFLLAVLVSILLLLDVFLDVFSGFMFYLLIAALPILILTGAGLGSDPYERKALAFKILCEEKGLTYKPDYSNARPTLSNPGKGLLIGISEKQSTILINTETQGTYVVGQDPTDGARLINVKDIIGVELLLNSNSVYQAGSIMSLAAAAVGGLTFGGAGAIVGSLTAGRKGQGKISELVLNLRMDSIDKPLEKIYFISKPVKASAAETELDLAEKWTNLIEVMRYRLANQDKTNS